jgi:hypothetical protein
MSPEASSGVPRQAELIWSSSRFRSGANRLISSFIEELLVPDCEYGPEKSMERSTNLAAHVNEVALIFDVESKRNRKVTYNQLANALLAHAVIHYLDENLSGDLIELAEEIRDVSSNPKPPKKSIIHPKISAQNMLELLYARE